MYWLCFLLITRAVSTAVVGLSNVAFTPGRLLGRQGTSWTPTSSTATPTIAPFAACTGTVAYCVGGSGGSDIILRCSDNVLQPGNCDDNLGEPPLGALCIDTAPPPGGSATCSAISSPTSTSSSSSTPSPSPTNSSTATPTIAPSAACTGTVAYCVGGSGGSDIILRCSDNILQPGNCDDNLDEPPLGALCIDTAPPPGGSATCSAISSPTPTSSSSSTPSPSPTTLSNSCTATPTIAPFAACTGTVAYCVGGSGGSDIILRCSDNVLQPGNCDDNLGEPPLGALCIDTAPPPGGSATCSAISSPTSTSSSSSTPSPSPAALSSSPSPTALVRRDGYPMPD